MKPWVESEGFYYLVLTPLGFCVRLREIDETILVETLGLQNPTEAPAFLQRVEYPDMATAQTEVLAEVQAYLVQSLLVLGDDAVRHASAKLVYATFRDALSPLIRTPQGAPVVIPDNMAPGALGRVQEPEPEPELDPEEPLDLWG